MTRTATRKPDAAVLQRGLRIVVAFQGIFLAPLAVWAEPIVNLVLGPGYDESAAVLRALAPFAFMLGISPMVALSVNYLGEARRRIPIAIGAVLINGAVDLALLSRVGIVAGALGTDLAYAFYVTAHLLILRAMIGLELRPLLAGVARAVAAGGAMALPLLAIGTGRISWPLMALGAVLGSAAYVTALLAIGDITLAELRLAGARLLSLAKRHDG